MSTKDNLDCDVAIIGGGFGGVAAALSACDRGMSVIMTEPTAWIGGQVTSQAVSALDEHPYIETVGRTETYQDFRERVRRYYYGDRYDSLGLGERPGLNPGNGWVSRLCFEPAVGKVVLEDMVSEHVQTGRLRILVNHRPVRVSVVDGQIKEVACLGPDNKTAAIKAKIFLDASELGDLLPLAHIPYATGAEARDDTGEPDAAPDGPHPERVQSFTSCFLVEYRPGETHVIEKPLMYETWRDTQPFSLILRTRGGSLKRFFMFEGDLPFWTYRRVYDAQQFQSPLKPFDIALINWDSNDYYLESLIDREPQDQKRLLDECKDLSLSFLYWLQTEAPHDDDGGTGFPGLRLLTDALGTTDGLGMYPYIREGRRVLGLHRVVEQDIIAKGDGAARAVHVNDSVGVGWYPIDLHRCVGDGGVKVDLPASLPFQIPLGALLTGAVDNWIAAGKCISTTHLTNGCYRLHPIEWNVGEAAGVLAAFCVSRQVQPRQVREDRAQLRQYQDLLMQRGVPLMWSTDLPYGAPGFREIQCCLLQSGIENTGSRFTSLELAPDGPISGREASALFRAMLGEIPPTVLDEVSRLADFPVITTACGPLFDYLGAVLPAWDETPTLRQVCTFLINCL